MVEYSLKKAKKIFLLLCKEYKSRKSFFTKDERGAFRHHLEKLQEAILQNDYKAASKLAKRAQEAHRLLSKKAQPIKNLFYFWELYSFL